MWGAFRIGAMKLKALGYGRAFRENNDADDSDFTEATDPNQTCSS
jgi:hypothetical protein